MTQAGGDQVAQLRLVLDRNGRVGATEVRRIQVPVLDGDPAESQTEGVVADPYYQLVHIAMEDGLGILTYDAEPDGDDQCTLTYAQNRAFSNPTSRASPSARRVGARGTHRVEPGRRLVRGVRPGPAP